MIEHTHKISLYDFPKHLLKFSMDPSSPDALLCSIHIESGTLNLRFYVGIIVHTANLLNVIHSILLQRIFFFTVAKQILVLLRNMF